jgi:shikimate kinase
MKNNNITLIGMPTSGKTYLGQKIAGRFRKKWVDLDTASYGKTLINGGTEEDYLELEEAVLLKAKGNNTVFGCSGSSVYSKKGMENLKSISQIIYLKLPYKIIEERLTHQYLKRGIVGSNNLTLKELYDQRAKLYQKYADITVECKDNSTAKQFDKLCELIEKF